MREDNNDDWFICEYCNEMYDPTFDDGYSHCGEDGYCLDCVDHFYGIDKRIEEAEEIGE
jgi:hypothetical protein